MEKGEGGWEISYGGYSDKIMWKVFNGFVKKGFFTPPTFELVTAEIHRQHRRLQVRRQRQKTCGLYHKSLRS